MDYREILIREYYPALISSYLYNHIYGRSEIMLSCQYGAVVGLLLFNYLLPNHCVCVYVPQGGQKQKSLVLGLWAIVCCPV